MLNTVHIASKFQTNESIGSNIIFFTTFLRQFSTLEKQLVTRTIQYKDYIYSGTGAARSRPEPPGAAWSRPEPPGAVRSQAFFWRRNRTVLISSSYSPHKAFVADGENILSRETGPKDFKKAQLRQSINKAAGAPQHWLRPLQRIYFNLFFI